MKWHIDTATGDTLQILCGFLVKKKIMKITPKGLGAIAERIGISQSELQRFVRGVLKGDLNDSFSEEQRHRIAYGLALDYTEYILAKNGVYRDLKHDIKSCRNKSNELRIEPDALKAVLKLIYMSAFEKMIDEIPV